MRRQLIPCPSASAGIAKRKAFLRPSAATLRLIAALNRNMILRNYTESITRSTAT